MVAKGTSTHLYSIEDERNISRENTDSIVSPGTGYLYYRRLDDKIEDKDDQELSPATHEKVNRNKE